MTMRALAAALALAVSIAAAHAAESGSAAASPWFDLSSSGLSAASPDNSSSLNAAFAAAAAKTAPVRLPGGSGATYKFTKGITFDVYRTALDCGGATLDFTGMTGGTALMLTTSNTADSASMMQVHNIHRVEDCRVLGPPASSGVDFATFKPVTINRIPWFLGVTWQRLGISGFANAFVMTEGTVAMNFEDITFDNDGNKCGAFITLAGRQNAGEAYHISHLFEANCADFLWDRVGNADADLFCEDCSIDGATHVVTGGKDKPGTAAARAEIVFHGGHIEAFTGTDYIAMDERRRAARRHDHRFAEPCRTCAVPVGRDAADAGHRAPRRALQWLGAQRQRCVLSLCRRTAPGRSSRSTARGSPPMSRPRFSANTTISCRISRCLPRRT